MLILEGASPPEPETPDEETAVAMALRLMEEDGLAPSDAARQAAARTGLKKGDIYRRLTRKPRFQSRGGAFMNPITAAGFFDAGQPGYYLLILAFLAALVGLYLWGNRHKDSDSRAARLGRLYRELDEDKLAGIPDEELVDAVAANLLEKQDRRRPDPYHTIPLLSRGRTAVYSVWLICNELDKGQL